MTIQELHSIFKKSSGIITDSRIIKENSLFFALKGESFDGNKFAHIALQNGSDYAIVDDASCCLDERCILVGNVLQTLQELARYHRRASRAIVVGITGTNGKTTTKELVSAVLGSTYSIISTKGNLNNHIGVPLTLLAIAPETEYAIIEMGANHPLEIKELCEIAEPDFGIISSIGRAHLEGFGSFENIIKTKKELFDFVDSRGGTLFVNSANELLVDISSHMRRILFGKEHTFCNGWFVSANPFVEIGVENNSTIDRVVTKLIGSYNLDNILAALCVGKYFNVPYEKAKIAIQNYSPENNRSQLIKTERNTLVMDAYNANPSSMSAALDNFKVIPADSKTVILGEMLELGAESGKEHEKILNVLKNMTLQNILLVGNWGLTDVVSNVNCFKNTAALVEYLKSTGIVDSTILVKGSRGNKLEGIIPYL